MVDGWHPKISSLHTSWFRFRLVGTSMVFALGQEPTGRWLDEHFQGFESSVFAEELKGAVCDGKPRHYRGSSAAQFARDMAAVERIALPLAGNGRNVDMLLGLTVFFDGKGQEIGPPRR